jgi:hypothetical protein
MALRCLNDEAIGAPSPLSAISMLCMFPVDDLGARASRTRPTIGTSRAGRRAQCRCGCSGGNAGSARAISAAWLRTPRQATCSKQRPSPQTRPDVGPYPIGGGYLLDLGAAIQAHKPSFAAITDLDRPEKFRRTMTRTAILLARPKKG